MSENDTKEIFRGAFWSPNCEVSIVPCQTVIMGLAKLSVEINLERTGMFADFCSTWCLILIGLACAQTKLNSGVNQSLFSSARRL